MIRYSTDLRATAAARKLRDAGGVYLNKSKVTDNYLLSEKDLIEGSVCLLRTGKGNYRVVHVIS